MSCYTNVGMEVPLCTLVIVPRDKFSRVESSYHDVMAHNSGHYPVIYVDGGSPQPWAGKLDVLAAEGAIKLIRTGFYITQHEAYNLALPHVRSKYVILLDNDINVLDGWAENLIQCAEETGAAAVMPLYEHREEGGDWIVHMCGADCGVEERNGKLYFNEIHPLSYRARPEEPFRRCQTGLMEYHACLVRKDILDQIGPFDEKLGPALDHTDCSLMIRAAGGKIWFEPSAVVRFQLPPPLDWNDKKYFLARWSPPLVAANERAFSDKWGVQFSNEHAVWYDNLRGRIYWPLRQAIADRFGSLAGKVANRTLRFIEPFVSRLAWVLSWVSEQERRKRLKALGSWQAPRLDSKYIRAFAEKIFRKPRPLQREIVDEKVALFQEPVELKA